MPDNIKQRMRTICTGKSEENFIDWTFNKPDKSGVRYGLTAFTRYPDGDFVDCLHVLYKMDFMIAPNRRGNSWKLWKKNDVTEMENPLDRINDEDFQNFCRLKTLEECYKEGHIEKINYVKSDEVEKKSTLPKDTSRKVSESSPETPKKIKTEQFDE